MVSQQSGKSGSNNSGEGSGGGGGGGGSRGQVLKKGPWTAAEDAVLLEYVKRHGEGNWNAVQKNSGLQRCGKSCRLRWANHLRPFLRKGPFTPDEEKIIIDLHSKLGNKWARMAAQLPGRTDNEIKNYWNTRLKRRQRAGLPIYPQEVLQSHQQPPPISLSSSSTSLASIISAAATSTTTHRHPNTATYVNNPSLLSLLNSPSYRNNNANVINSTSSFSFLPGINNSSNGFSFPNNTINSAVPIYSYQPLSRNSPLFQSLCLNPGGPPALPSSATRAARFDPVGLLQIGVSPTGLSSIQAPGPQIPAATVTQTSSGYTGSDGVFGGTSSGSGEEYDQVARRNSGLLGDLLHESQAISRNDKSNNGMFREDNGYFGSAVGDLKIEDFNHEVYKGDSSSAHSYIGMNEKNHEVSDDMNVMDDDLLHLLDCPSPVSIPDWYDVASSTNGQPSNATDDDVIVETNNGFQMEAASAAPAATSSEMVSNNNNWEEGFCCWNNMPRVHF